MMVLTEQNEGDSETVSSPGKMTASPRKVSFSSVSSGADMFDEQDILNRFSGERRVSPARRRQSYAGYRSAPLELPAGLRRESFGRRLSEGNLMRPKFSSYKRDKDLKKICDEMDGGCRKAEEETGSLAHELESLRTMNMNVSKRIDRLIDASAEMRQQHRHVFPNREGSQLYNLSQSVYENSQKSRERRKSSHYIR